MKRTIRIEDGTNTYIIDLNDILYFTKETFDRKTSIKTDYDVYFSRVCR